MSAALNNQRLALRAAYNQRLDAAEAEFTTAMNATNGKPADCNKLELLKVRRMAHAYVALKASLEAASS